MDEKPEKTRQKPGPKPKPKKVLENRGTWKRRAKAEPSGVEPFDLEHLVHPAMDYAKTVDWPSLLSVIPGYDSYRNSDGYHFDEIEASKVIWFVEHYISLPDIDKPYVLPDWQKAILALLWGWRAADGTRRYREAFIFVARGNAKSVLCSAILLYSLLTGQAKGSEIVCVAGDKDQARIVHGTAREMIVSSPPLYAIAEAKRLAILTNRIVLDDFDVAKIVSSSAKLKEGGRTALCIFDELHVQDRRTLYDVLRKNCRKRQGSLFISITTAGSNAGVARELYDYGKKVLSGEYKDAKFLPVIYEPAEGVPWDSVEAIKAANPNLNVSIQQDEIEDAIKRAKLIPSEEPDVKIKHVNIWTSSSDVWLPMDAWDACNAKMPDDSVLIKSRAYGGWDGGVVDDWSVFSAFWPDHKCVRIWVWVPDDRIVEKEQLHACPYRAWARQGLITLIPGKTRKDSVVIEDLTSILGTYNIAKIGADQSRSVELLSELVARRFPIFEFRQGWREMTPACEALERMVVNHEFVHGGNPVLRYAAENTGLYVVPNATARACRPVKANEFRKIDPIAATLDAIGTALKEPRQTSVYAQRAAGVTTAPIRSNSTYASRGNNG